MFFIAKSINIVSRLGRWFIGQVDGSPENELDSLLWGVFCLHAFLVRIELVIVRQKPISILPYSLFARHLRGLWHYYWAFTSREYKDKSQEVIHQITKSQPKRVKYPSIHQGYSDDNKNGYWRAIDDFRLAAYRLADKRDKKVRLDDILRLFYDLKTK